MRLVNQRNVQWRIRAHFYGIASQMIRRIVVDYVRAHQAGKRGAGTFNPFLDDARLAQPQQDLDSVALDDTLQLLSGIEPQQGRAVELRFFAGLSIEEPAEVIGISTATVKREWSTARAWLFRELSRGQAQE